MGIASLDPERIEIGDEMSAHAIGANEIHRPDGIERRLLHVLRQVGQRGGMAVRRRRRDLVPVGDQCAAFGAPARPFHLAQEGLRLLA